MTGAARVRRGGAPSQHKQRHPSSERLPACRAWDPVGCRCASSARGPPAAAPAASPRTAAAWPWTLSAAPLGWTAPTRALQPASWTWYHPASSVATSSPPSWRAMPNSCPRTARPPPALVPGSTGMLTPGSSGRA
eukprot:scaffold17636_cov120-Isochrysis_galbana.AAC.10